MLAEYPDTTRGALYKTLHEAHEHSASRSGPKTGPGIRERTDERAPDDELRMILGGAGPDIRCDGCSDQLDRYVEAEIAGGHADAPVPGMRTHIEGCAGCREGTL